MRTATTTPVEPETCPHHWLIEPPDARVGNETLDAVCRLCGAARTFPKVAGERGPATPARRLWDASVASWG